LLLLILCRFRSLLLEATAIASLLAGLLEAAANASLLMGLRNAAAIASLLLKPLPLNDYYYY
jgi:hypothetical protein